MGSVSLCERKEVEPLKFVGHLTWILIYGSYYSLALSLSLSLCVNINERRHTHTHHTHQTHTSDTHTHTHHTHAHMHTVGGLWQQQRLPPPRALGGQGLQLQRRHRGACSSKQFQGSPHMAVGSPCPSIYPSTDRPMDCFCLGCCVAPTYQPSGWHTTPQPPTLSPGSKTEPPPHTHTWPFFPLTGDLTGHGVSGAGGADGGPAPPQ
jgi:hypothetical protein